MKNRRRYGQGLPRLALGVNCFISLLIAGVYECSAQNALAQTEQTLYPFDAFVAGPEQAWIVDRNLPGVWHWKSSELSILYAGSKRFRTPLNAPRCLALDRDGHLLVGDASTRDIYRIDAQGQPQPITGGKIGIPMDLAVKSDGTLYVADLETRSVLRIPYGTDRVEQVAAVNPRGLFVDAKDQLWVVSQDAQQLLIVADDGSSQVIVGQRTFDFPHQVVVNGRGEAFVLDGYRKAIWKVVPGSVPQVITSGAPLQNPVGLALQADQLIIIDPHARTVFRMNPQGALNSWFEIRR